MAPNKNKKEEEEKMNKFEKALAEWDKTRKVTLTIAELKKIIQSEKQKQFRKDTDERVQSIKEAKQEQLEEDIKTIETLYVEQRYNLPLGTPEFHIGYLQGLKDGHYALKKKKVD